METPLEAAKNKVKRILNSSRLYASNFLKIKTKAGTLVALVYNSAQKILAKVWDDLDTAGKPVRIIVLKARREGISTFVQSRFFHFCATKKYRHGKVVAHEGEATETLFDMSKTFYDAMPQTVEMPSGQRAQIRPYKEYSNAKEMTFSDLKSQLSLKTAGKDSENKGAGTGRSQTVHFLHCSEVAFWPAAKQTLTALLQTVPNLPGTVVILESTANGVGDHFHKLWQMAKNGENDYIAVFLPWHIFDEYQIALDPGETMEPYDEEEQSLFDRFPHMTPEKIKWRRYTLKNECQGDLDQFHQEYPADDQEAFIVSGRPFFGVKSLLAIRDKHQSKPIRRGYLKEIDNKLEFVDDSKGYISVWKEPEPGHFYCIGGDVAEGLAKGDYSNADVLDRKTLEQVAQWHGHIDPDEFGVECVRLAKWYNQGALGIESNNHGISANKAAIRTGYSRIYIQQVMDEAYPDRTQKIGWRTDTKTRPLMLDELEKVIRSQTIIIHCEGTINECLTFVRNEKGKPEAQGDCYDDRVMGLAIAVQMHTQMPMYGVISEEERRRRERERREQTRPSSKVTGW